MICWRPRIRIVPEACHANETTLYLEFTIDSPEGPESWSAEMTNRWDLPDLRVESSPPYTSFELYSGDERLFEQDVAWWLSQIAFMAENASEQPSLFDLEILYVGQAYGAEGSRNARDRLVNHSTLQAVYAKANTEAPHKEVSIVLLGIENPVHLVRLNGSSEPVDDDEAAEELVRLLTTAPSLGQRINFTEAALIRYFRPPFNEKFRDIFPSRSHTSYGECFDLDFNSVGFTIDGRTLFGRLWSDAVDPEWLHMKTYLLHSPAERRDMFEFVGVKRPGPEPPSQ